MTDLLMHTRVFQISTTARLARCDFLVTAHIMPVDFWYCHRKNTEFQNLRIEVQGTQYYHDNKWQRGS